MAHMRQQIIEAMQTELISQSVASGRVLLDTTYDLTILPAVRLVQAADSRAETQTIAYVHRELELSVELFATHATNVASPLNQLDADVFAVLATHGWRPDSIEDVQQTGTSEIEIIENADKPTAGMIANYLIRYRHNELDAELFS